MKFFVFLLSHMLGNDRKSDISSNYIMTDANISRVATNTIVHNDTYCLKNYMKEAYSSLYPEIEHECLKYHFKLKLLKDVNNKIYLISCDNPKLLNYTMLCYTHKNMEMNSRFPICCSSSKCVMVKSCQKIIYLDDQPDDIFRDEFLSDNLKDTIIDEGSKLEESRTVKKRETFYFVDKEDIVSSRSQKKKRKARNEDNENEDEDEDENEDESEEENEEESETEKLKSKTKTKKVKKSKRNKNKKEPNKVKKNEEAEEVENNDEEQEKSKSASQGKKPKKSKIRMDKRSQKANQDDGDGENKSPKKSSKGKSKKSEKKKTAKKANKDEEKEEKNENQEEDNKDSKTPQNEKLKKNKKKKLKKRAKKERKIQKTYVRNENDLDYISDPTLGQKNESSSPSFTSDNIDSLTETMIQWMFWPFQMFIDSDLEIMAVHWHDLQNISYINDWW